MRYNTILHRLGMTQAQLEAKYDEIGNLRLLAEVLGVSKTTLHKYLRHKTQHTKPWSAVRKGKPHADKDYLRHKYRKEAMESLDRALLTKKVWTDVNGRKIPREAILHVYAEAPRKLSPIMPVYARLRDSPEPVIFMFHPNVDWVHPATSDQEHLEYSEDGQIHHTFAPSASSQHPSANSSESYNQEPEREDHH